jgi:hypothetical protein
MLCTTDDRSKNSTWPVVWGEDVAGRVHKGFRPVRGLGSGVGVHFDVKIAGPTQDCGRTFQIALVSYPHWAFEHVAIPQDEKYQRRHGAEADGYPPQIFSGAKYVSDIGGGEADKCCQAPIYVAAVHEQTSTGPVTELNNEAQRHREVQADAQPHQQTEKDQNRKVRRQCRANRGDNEEPQVQQEHVFAADFVDEVSAEQRTEHGTDRHGGRQHADRERRQMELVSQLYRADTQAGEVVGIHEDTAQRDDHQQQCLAAGLTLRDGIRMIDPAIDDGAHIVRVANKDRGLIGLRRRRRRADIGDNKLSWRTHEQLGHIHGLLPTSQTESDVGEIYAGTVTSSYASGHKKVTPPDRTRRSRLCCWQIPAGGETPVGDTPCEVSRGG